MKVWEARNWRDLLFIIGILTSLAGEVWFPLAIIGFVVVLSGLVLDFLYNKCPHCGKHMGRNRGDFCPNCGRKID